MTKRKLSIMALGLLIMALGCGLVYAAVSVEVTNHFETGIVDINLMEYQIDESSQEEMPWVDEPTVFPGEYISKIPRVHNDGNDCYIRAKVTMTPSEGMPQEDFEKIEIGGTSEKWLLADDGYLYYTDILKTGEDADVFEWVSIPVDMTNESQDERFYINVEVDAIQSKNFTPEFSSATPWGSVEVLACEKEGQYEISSLKKADSQSFKVQYQGDAKKLITNSDDFFANLPYMMPGDSFNDVARLVNTSSNDIKLYFRSEALDDSELLDKIQLKITTEIGGKKVVYYEGSLRAAALSESAVIGTIPAKSEGNFHFDLHVPAELNNQYSISSSYVKWIFSTEEIPQPGPDKPDSPKTGDEADLNLWMGMFGGSLVAIGMVVMMSVTDRKKKGAASHE